MKKYNAIISFCLLATFFLASAPSVAGTLTTFQAQTFSTAVYARDIEYFTIGADSFIAMANYSTSSKIYKWNGSAYTLFQSLTTNDAYELEFFTIDTDYYLAVANYGGDSVIFQWDATGDGNGGEGTGAFEVYQTIATQNAQAWEFFTIGSDSFLVVANHKDGTNYTIDSVIYKWGTDDQFAVYQNIATVGAIDWESFTIGTDTYLMVANHRNAVDYDINSILYRWNGLLFEEIQAIPTQGAYDWEFFTMGGDSFLAVANYRDAGYALNSKIYKWDGSAFVEFQSIATNGATEWEFFSIANDGFLVVINNRAHTTQVFKYDGTTFTSWLTLTGSNYHRASTFFTKDSEAYLAVALDYGSTSKLYKANLTNDPTATIQEVNACPGQSVTLDLDVWGDEPIDYQWQFYGEDIAGATSDSYTIPTMEQRYEGIYECVMENVYGTATSNALTLTQNPLILIEDLPNDIISCEGETVTFGLVATGFNLRYQWAYNGTDIPGAIHPTYTKEDITTADAGAFTCEVSGACTTVTTDAVNLTVSTTNWIQMELPEISNVPGEQVSVPISLSGVNGLEIDSFTFVMSFDPTQLSYLSHSTAGTLIDGWTVPSHATESTVAISGANSVPFGSDGVLIVLYFEVNDTASEGSCGDIVIDYGLLNEGEFCVSPVSGTFCGCLKGDSSQSGAITASDATQVLRHMAEMPTTPTELSLCNTDTTCNGAISTLDAVRILEYTIGRIGAFCGASAKGTTGDVTVTIPDQTLTTSDQLTIPLVLGETTGMEIKGLVFTLEYDPEHLQITGINPTHSLLTELEWQYEVNTSIAGQITIAAAGFTALTGSGTLLNLTGTAHQWGQTELTVTQLDFNEGQPTAVLTDRPTNYRILAIEPRSVARGLDIPQFEVMGCCDALELEWRDPELDLVLPGNPLILDPPPQYSTTYEARITNPITLETLVKRAHVLVPVYPFTLDYNGDGYNTLEDLNMLLPDWQQPLAIDPNGDGFVDIRDFLYINVSDD